LLRAGGEIFILGERGFPDAKVDTTAPVFAALNTKKVLTLYHLETGAVIRLMQSVVRAGDHVADLGSGSAVLAIAAAKLGATHVAAIELDPDAIGNAEENVERNGVGDAVKVIEGDAASLLPLVAPVRVILANIISSVLVELLPSMSMALADDGQMILSGILFSEREGMMRELADSGWRVIAEDHEEMWWSATVAR